MIYVLSRQGFKDTDVIGHAISIWGTSDYIDQDVMESKLESMKSYLKLEFDDITKLIDPIVSGQKRHFIRFNLEHLESIRQFISKIPDEEDIVVHCDAGISRSAAIGEALGMILDVDVEYERPATYPNSFISRVMKRYWDRAN